MVKEIGSGACFGEVALITKEPRNATVAAKTDVTAGGSFLITFQIDFKVLHINIITVLDVNAFERLLGPCREIMARNIDKYAEELAKLSVSD